MPDDSHDGTEPVKDFRRVSVGDGLEKDIEVTEDGTLEKSPTGHDRMMSASVALDPAAERRLMWKFDLHILLVLTIMYLFNAVDKSNLGKIMRRLRV
jgi:hypothetical protein